MAKRKSKLARITFRVEEDVAERFFEIAYEQRTTGSMLLRTYVYSIVDAKKD